MISIRRFRSLWLDYAPAQSKEAKLILSAVQEGVGGILINALDQDDAEKKRSIKRCEQQLADAYITGDGARFAVREIASALRMDVDRLVPLSEAETISANQLPQREPKSVPADQMPGAHRKSTSSPQESPQSLERETTKRDPGYEEFLANNAAKEAPVRRKKSSLVPLLALMLAAGAAAGWFLNKGSADVPDVPAVVAPADAQTDQESLPAIIPPVLPDEDDEAESAAPSDDKNLEGIVPPILPVEDVESVVPPEDENVKEIIPPVLPAKDEEKEPEEPVQQETKPYLIDTVAANLNDFKSMVLDNQNNLYYIGSTEKAKSHNKNAWMRNTGNKKGEKR